jgi:hypothetical protein
MQLLLVVIGTVILVLGLAFVGIYILNRAVDKSGR